MLRLARPGKSADRHLHLDPAAAAAHLESKDIDVTFLEYFDVSENVTKMVKDHVDPDNIVFMHFPAQREQKKRIVAQFKAAFPDAIVFWEKMEKLKL